MFSMLYTLATVVLSVLPITDIDGRTKGSAVLLDHKTVLTVAHATGPVRTAVFLRCGTDDIVGIVTKREPVYDLATLELQQPCKSEPFITLAATDAENGTSVTVEGFPQRVYKRVTTEVLSTRLSWLPPRIAGFGYTFFAMMLATPLAPGTSGGPVFANGELVGIVHGYTDTEGVAIPLRTIKRFLASNN